MSGIGKAPQLGIIMWAAILVSHTGAELAYSPDGKPDWLLCITLQQLTEQTYRSGNRGWSTTMTSGALQTDDLISVAGLVVYQRQTRTQHSPRGNELDQPLNLWKHSSSIHQNSI